MNPALDSSIRNSVRAESTWGGVLDCAVKEVFQIMLQKDLTSLPEPENGAVSADTTAMVGLAGALCGVLSIRCSSATAERVAGAMLGTPKAVSPREVADALAEICNMVAGNFKAKISLLADRCMLSVPTVIRGEDYEMITVAEGDRISILLDYEGSPLWVKLAIHP